MSFAQSILSSFRSSPRTGREDATLPHLSESLRRKTYEASPRLCAVTDVGASRDNNEDAFYISSDGMLWIVADGMGGQAAGELASTLTIESVVGTLMAGSSGTAPQTRLVEGLQAAQATVLRHAAEHQECHGMGSAVAAVYLDGNLLNICHAGDVRCYLLREKAIDKVTEDHSLMNALVRAKLLTEDQARSHPDRGRLEQAVGIAANFAPAVTQWSLVHDDRVLICSDGLWEMLSRDELARVACSDGSMRQLATVLVDRANAAGGPDNITAILYRHE
jgi:PPM family protein phosphatase